MITATVDPEPGQAETIVEIPEDHQSPEPWTLQPKPRSRLLIVGAALAFGLAYSVSRVTGKLLQVSRGILRLIGQFPRARLR